MNVRIKTHGIPALGATILGMAALTGACHAQAIDERARSVTGHVNEAAGYFMNMVCYLGGGGLLIGSLIFAYLKHKRRGNSDIGYGAILAALVVGTGLLCLPYYVGTASSTLFDTKASITGEQQTIRFEQ
jgi:hypothetical protein